MSSIARLCWLYCTALPLQRWLLYPSIALVLLAGSLLSAVAVRSFSIAGPYMPLLLTVTTVLVLLQATLVSGFAFRVVSGSRVFWFAPHARLKMLAAALMVPLTAVLLIAVPMMLMPGKAGAGPAAALALIPVFMLSVVTWVSFAPLGGTFALLFFGFLPLLVVLHWLASAFPGFPWGRGVELWAAGVLLLVASWGVFSYWYLRAHRIAHKRWGWVSDDQDRFAARVQMFLMGAAQPNDPVRSDTSRGVYWHGRPVQRSYLRWLLASLWALASLFAPLVLLWYLHDTPRMTAPFLAFLLLVAIMIFVLLAGFWANQIARRARLLWLRGMRSRGALFEEAEKQIWRGDSGVMFVIVLVALLLLVRFFFDLSWIVMSGVTVTVAVGMALSTYIGMLAVRGVGAIEIAAVGALLASLAAAGGILLGGGPGYGVLAWVVAFQLVCVRCCRSIARRRWETIDWTRFRPPRLSSQGLRA